MTTARRKVCIIYGSIAYQNLFTTSGYAIVNTVPEADLVCFTGGEDVDPSYYGQLRHKTTYSNTDRDRREMAIYHAARDRDIPCVGICRGGQFLNVMNDGEMYQHVTAHTGAHTMHDVFHDERYLVTSTHHQMMMPGKNAEVIGYAEHGTEREWFDAQGNPMKDQVDFGFEVLLYREAKTLCYQPHPEMHVSGPMRHRFMSLIDNLLFPKTPLTLVK